ncbi:NmrA family NAD(P)-binding protein [Burkholderia sp. 22PA0099]|uniref:NmrA family NAD(P)-binding protein n=1 Tax=Burkholderia sp. 22PA0099 TaxID=3237372 RepID=UPI0039C46E99
MNTTILIAGAAGSTGRVATAQLLEKGFAVRALVRRQDARAEKLQALGAEIVVADLLDFRAVRRAFDGAQRGYFVYPMRPGLLEATANFAQAALDTRAEVIVNMSQRTARPDAISTSALQHWMSERLFDRSGVPAVHLRPTAFAEWFLYMRNMVRAGRYGVPFDPEGRFATVAAEDLGRVAAAVLAEPAAHLGQTYPLYGPEELSPPELAAIASQVLGREIRYERITAEQWVQEVAGQEIPFLAQHLNGITEDHRQGMMAGTNDIIERLTGRKPMSVAAFVEQHRAAFE